MHETQTNEEQRAAKRAALTIDLQSARQKLQEALDARTAANAEVSNVRAGIQRIEDQIRYRTGTRLSVLDLKAEALARAALGTGTLDEARSVEGGTQTQMSISELNSALEGLTNTLRDAETSASWAAQAARRASAKVIELRSAIFALDYDAACAALLDRWADLRALGLRLEARGHTSPIWHATWAQLRVPKHTHPLVPDLSRTISTTHAAHDFAQSAAMRAAEDRIGAEIHRLGVEL